MLSVYPIMSFGPDSSQAATPVTHSFPGGSVPSLYGGSPHTSTPVADTQGLQPPASPAHLDSLSCSFDYGLVTRGSADSQQYMRALYLPVQTSQALAPGLPMNVPFVPFQQHSFSPSTKLINPNHSNGCDGCCSSSMHESGWSVDSCMISPSTGISTSERQSIATPSAFAHSPSSSDHSCPYPCSSPLSLVANPLVSQPQLPSSGPPSSPLAYGRSRHASLRSPSDHSPPGLQPYPSQSTRHSPQSKYPASSTTSRSSSPILSEPGRLQAMMATFTTKQSSPTPKRYMCQVCMKKFARPSSLQTHSYSHTGEKPFQCPVEGCGRHFSVVSNLRRHAKIHM